MTDIDQTNGDSKGGKSNRRRTYFVNPAFQWRYIITIAATVFLASSALSTVLYTVLHEQARMRVMQPNSYTANVASVVLISALVFSGLTAGVLGLWCFVATHRICGPLFVLQRYMSQIAAGHLPTLRPLRRKDEFKDLYAVCSRAVEALKAKRDAQLTLIGQAQEAVRQGLEGDDKARKDSLDLIASHLDILRRGGEQKPDSNSDDKPTVTSEAAKQVEMEPTAVA